MVSAKVLQEAVADLQTTRPGPGLLKVTFCTAGVWSCSAVALMGSDPVSLVAAGMVGSVFFSCLLIMTHDAIHHTLTGIRRLDEMLARRIAWPSLWPHTVYSEVHKLHHNMNGDDLKDPERVQWSIEEYAQASPLARFYVRYQWHFNIFVFGGFGLMYKTLAAAFKHAGRSQAIRRALVTDAVGIMVTNGLIYGLAFYFGVAGRWLVFYLIIERLSGGVMQWRAHVEHYGLWGKGRHYFETQAYSTRNIVTNAFTSWFFNGLNYHSVHHAFPKVPFYALKVAHQRLRALYAETSEPLVEDRGYLAASFRLMREPSLIGPIDPRSPSNRRLMQPLDGQTWPTPQEQQRAS